MGSPRRTHRTQERRGDIKDRLQALAKTSSNEAKKGSPTKGASKSRNSSRSGKDRGRNSSSGRKDSMERVMERARAEGGNRWTKKLLDEEAKDPGRWGHSGFKELYKNELGINKNRRSRSRTSPRRSRSRDRLERSSRGSRKRRSSERSPLRRTDKRNGTVERKPKPIAKKVDERRRDLAIKKQRVVKKRSLSRSISRSPLRTKTAKLKSKRGPISPPDRSPTASPLLRRRTSVSESSSSSCSSLSRSSSSSSSSDDSSSSEASHRVPKPRSPPLPPKTAKKPLLKARKRPSRSESESSSSSESGEAEEDEEAPNDEVKNQPVRLSLSERFGKLAQLSSQRRNLELVQLRIVAPVGGAGTEKNVSVDETSAAPVISQAQRERNSVEPAQPVNHRHHQVKNQPEEPVRQEERPRDDRWRDWHERYDQYRHVQPPRQLPRDWDDIRVRHKYYTERGYFGHDMTLEELSRWEAWWHRYQQWRRGYEHAWVEAHGPHVPVEYPDWSDYRSSSNRPAAVPPMTSIRSRLGWRR